MKASTDETGQPFAYNGEARDVTGLDYLRARYYDSQAGTFLTEDSYQGELTNPLSQNLYAYVENNPINYTDPSGHFLKGLVRGFKKVYNSTKRAVVNTYRAAKRVVVNTYNTAKRAVVNTYNTVKSAVGHAINWVNHKVNQAVTWFGNKVSQAKQWVSQQWNNFRQTPVYQSAQRAYKGVKAYYTYQYHQATQTVSNMWETAKATGQSVYNWGASKTREAINIAQNWTKSLEETVRHVCTTAFRIGEDGINFLKNIDWKKTLKISIYAGKEFLSVNAAQRFITGKDPLTGKKVSRLEAGGDLLFDLATNFFPAAKVGKGAKIAKVIDAIDDVHDASKAAKAAKAIDAVDDISDASKAAKAAKTADAVDDAHDASKAAKAADAVDDVGNARKTYTPPKGGGGSTRKIVKGNTSVTFGHGGRHFDNVPNANISEIEEAIAEHVAKNPPRIGESPRVTIDVNGISVEYRPFNLGDGRINIGTYIPRN